jgi:adenylate kinase family enzyme
MISVQFGQNMISLDEMGKRICIIGCSNSGKSTLADALSKKLDILAHHLDQYAHFENSKWQRKSDEMLIESHRDIIHQESWIIDGNHSVCMNERLDNATFVIWIDPNVYSSVFRYLFRSIKNDPNRPGRLAGAKNEFSLGLIKWIVFNYPKNRKKYQKSLESKPNLSVLHIESIKSLNVYYAFWGIS